MKLNPDKLKLNRLIQSVVRLNGKMNQWLDWRQLQVLEEAYQGAREIEALEEQHFNGDKIAYTPNQSKTVFDYVQSLRDRQLLRIRVNLTQFRVGGFFLGRQFPTSTTNIDTLKENDLTCNLPLSLEAEVLAKLNFIDSVISKYRELSEENFDFSTTNALVQDADSTTTESLTTLNKETSKDSIAKIIDPPTIAANPNQTQRKKSGFFLGGFSLNKELDPEYEQQVVTALRLRRQQSKLALRWLLILLLVPLLVQVFTKNLIFDPLLGSYSDKNPTKVELSREIQEEILTEFNYIKEGLEVRNLLGLLPELTEEQKRERLHEALVDLWRESRNQAQNGLKNILADGVAIAAFAGLIYFNRSKLVAIRSFSNRSFLSLSDPAKVFLFILVTDMFVGFHSAEGWEVLLEAIAHHFGFPESKAAINIFIATVPVIIDSCIKFAIFSYLTRFSPSASAIYERMNT